MEKISTEFPENDKDIILSMRALEISQWKGLTEISQRNDELLEKLKELRVSKNYEKQKFETLLRLPAREVNSFMENESKKVESEKMTENDQLEVKIGEEKRERAALTLQKYFRKIHISAKKREFNGRISRIKMKRRIELLEVINNRLNERKIMKRIRGDEVRSAYESHRDKIRHNADFIKLAAAVKRHTYNLSRPNSPTRFKAKLISTLAQSKAKKAHEERMAKLDLTILQFVFDGSSK